LQWLADKGELRNEQRFRHEGDGIWAVKGYCGLRAYGFFTHVVGYGRSFVVSHYIMKKRLKADSQDLERAKRARERM
jgi:phage-related protein